MAARRSSRLGGGHYDRDGRGQHLCLGPYGEPANDNWTGSRFRYTGQIALPEARLNHYKARVYDPVLGGSCRLIRWGTRMI
ncbi:MAG: hypothetical protein WDM79_02175 [Terricaulis sp.]